MDIQEIIYKYDISSVSDFLPLINNIFQTVKNRQFRRRIEANEERLKKLHQLIPEADYDFFAGEIGTIVIQKILLDEEDDKAEFFILGFENCVKNNFKDEDKIITLFDIISNLRMIDIKRLIHIYNYKNNNEPSKEISADFKPYIRYVDEKLSRLGLIMKEIIEGDEVDTNLDNVVVTSIAFQVLDFIGHTGQVRG